MKIVQVGDCLGNADQYQIGEGVYSKKNKLYAGIYGYLQETQSDSSVKIISVCQKLTNKSQSLKINQEVICRILKIREDHAIAQIIRINDQQVSSYMEGQIRKLNVRQSEVDKVQMEESFLPGDIVKAKVISYGDSRKIYLSTAENQLGVMFAWSKLTKEMMLPYSWQELICPISQQLEKRKVAKPDLSIFKC